MKWLKISASLLSVLAAMRLGSWTVGWILAKLPPLRTKFVAIIANLLAFAAFVLLLIRDLLPGESLDLTALVFGIFVFAIYCWVDFHWCPWRRRV
jgi:hypothetical protein